MSLCRVFLKMCNGCFARFCVKEPICVEAARRFTIGRRCQRIVRLGQLGSCMPLDFAGFFISLDFLFHRKGVGTLSGTTPGDVCGW